MYSTQSSLPEDSGVPNDTGTPPAMSDASRISLPGILENIFRQLPPNEIACTVRLLNKELSLAFRPFIAVRLSQPVPPHAFIRRWGSPASLASMPLRKRRELLFLTAASGCLSNLEVVAASAGLVLQTCPRQSRGNTGAISTALEAAAAAGRLELCIYLREQGCPWAGSLTVAAAAGQTAVCHWLLASGCPWDRAAVYAAARGGHVGLMDSLQAQRPSAAMARDTVRASGLLVAAAEGCDLATLQRLHDQLLAPAAPPAPAPNHSTGPTARAPLSPSQHQRQHQQLLSVDKAAILVAAASSPTADWRDKVEWLEGLETAAPDCGIPGIGGGSSRRPRAVSAAAGICAKAAALPDALERVSWLYGRGYPLNAAAVSTAAAAGNLPLLEYLLDRGLQPSYGAAEAAAAAGQLGVLQALHARRLPVPWHALEGAAEAGHLDVLVWLQGRGYGNSSLSGPTVLGGARSGSAAVMVWLLEQRQRCLWPVKVPMLRSTAEGGCGEALRLLAATRGFVMEDNAYPYYVAAVNGDLGTMRCLRELGCPWGPPGELLGLCIADGDCAPPVLAWLLEAGCPVGPWEAVVAVAGRRTGPDREAVRAWLQQQAQLEAAQGAVARVEIGGPPA